MENTSINQTDARQGRPSGSAFSRYAHCSGSFALEQSCESPVQLNKEIAERGTLLHSVLETGEMPHGLSFEDQSFIEIAWSQVRSVLSEIRTEWEKEKPEIILERRLWMYRKMKPIYSGQIDLQVVFDDFAVIFDYKTGWGNYPDSDTNEQFKAYAPLVWDDLDGKSKFKGLYVARIQPNKGKPSVAFWDAETIENHRTWALNVVHSLESMSDIRSPGDHCKYCSAHTVCPEALKYSASAIEKIDVNALTTESQIVAAYEILSNAELLKNKFKEKLKLILSEEGKEITSPITGKVYKLGKPKSNREIPDKNIKEAWNKASATLDEESILSCMKLSISQLESKYVEHHHNLSKLGNLKVTKKALKEQFQELFSELAEKSETSPSIVQV
jgi:hypothetical protein